MVLESVLLEKLSNMALTGIIAPIVTNALPFDEDKMNSNIRKSVINYTGNALEAMGGISAYISNITKESDLKKKKFGADIIGLCTEAATAATTRISNGILADNIKTMNEIVDPAAFTKAEVESLIKGAESISSSKISNLIKNKTVKVVEAEQEAYDREDKLNQELKNEVSKDSLISPIGEEGYKDIVLGKDGLRGHVSLFSRLQEESMKSLLFAPESDLEAINFDKLYFVTMEQTLDIFPEFELNPVKALENDLSACNCEPMTDERKAKIAEMSTIFAIVMYTFFETCNTMGICKPSMATVSKFVNPENEYAKRVGVANEISAEDKIKNSVGTYADYLQRTSNRGTPEGVQEALTQIASFRNKISETPLVGVAATECLTKLDDVSKSLEEQLKKFVKPATEATEDTYYDKLRKEEDVAAFSRVKTTLGNNPRIDTIRFTLASESDKSIRVQGVVSNTGHIVRENIIEFHYPKVGSVYDYVKECLEANNFAEVDKRKEFKYGDSGVKEYL